MRLGFNEGELVKGRNLDGYRIIDLTDERGCLAGKILGDLGADVIKVERPEGDPARRLGPFVGDHPDPQLSLHWFAFSTSKRGVTLDLHQAADRNRFLQLVKHADAVIESFNAGGMARLGLGYPELRLANPKVVLTSITAFGQTGPYASWNSCDLVNVAMGGLMFLTGRPDGPPLRISFPQSYLHAAAEAAAATEIAIYDARKCGRGQWVDVSAQACVATISCFITPMREMSELVLRRSIQNVREHLWRCIDGFVSFRVLGGMHGAKSNRALVSWMDSEGFSIDSLSAVNWDEWDAADPNDEQFLAIERAVYRFFGAQKKEEIIAGAVLHGLPIYPARDLKEVVEEDIQLAARDYWTPVHHPELSMTIRYPGPFARFSETECGISCRAPLIGEHNREVFGETEINDGDSSRSQVAECPPSLTTAFSGTTLCTQSANSIGRAMPLKGVKVLDLSWVAAGPLIVKYLAENGADVVRVESMARPDITRLSGPYKDGIPGVNRTRFAYFHANERSLSVDLRHPKGRSIVLQLVAWADVVVENFRAGVMEKMGLAYEDMKAVNENVIFLRSSSLGQTGPLSRQPGFGFAVANLAGFSSVTGERDGLPIEPYYAYTDWVSPRFGAAAVLAALLYRDKTGKGQCIDLSQHESSLHFLGPLLLDYTVNGRIATRDGNRSPYAAPHGAYRCLGADRWCVIAIFSDEEWQRLCTVMGWPKLAADPRFVTLAGRKAHEDELDLAVQDCVVSQEAEVVVTRLQSVRIAAGVVQDPVQVLGDKQLAHRGFFWQQAHPELGLFTAPGPAFRLSETPAHLERPSPCLGEHTEEVCREILGMSDAEFLELLELGVFE